MVESKKGPFLAAALICEKVLEETDGVKSAIRIFDRLTIGVPEQPGHSLDSFQCEIFLLLIFKLDELEEKLYRLHVDLIDPQGEIKSAFDLDVPFEGRDKKGMDVVINSNLRFDKGGTYWFSVLLNNVWMTQVPLRIELYTKPTTEVN